MARPRMSLAQAEITGAIYKDPQRFRGRNEPYIGDPLGDPPDYLSEAEANAWRDIAVTLPWLNRSHGCIMHIAARLTAGLRQGTLGVPGMQLLRVTLGQLGATPADRHRVPDLPAETGGDPADEFFR